MIEAKQWVAEALAGLKEKFGRRLLYLGLQGSYQRGEATESSDIDLVTILDEVTLDDLDAYRRLVRALPEGDKACGFICGATDLAGWPRHELFPFKMDTADYHGRLEDFLPPISRSDICEHVRIGASALVHFLTHSYIYAEPGDRLGILRESCKAAFFVIRVSRYLDSGVYCNSKKELLAHLDDSEKEIVAAGLGFDAWLARESEKQAFELLLGWGRGLLKRDMV